MKSLLVLVFVVSSAWAQSAGGLSSWFTPETGTNLLTNGSFDSGWTGWANNHQPAATFSIDSSIYHSGGSTASLKMVLWNKR
jgi:hypothetical protein